MELLEDAEPIFHLGGNFGVLVLHGFTGCPQSMKPLAYAYIQAGFSLNLPLLPGHGTEIDNMLDKKYEDFYQKAKDELNRLKEVTSKQAIVGLSMGGTLAVDLASKENISSLVLINPLVEPPDKSILDLLISLKEQGVKSTIGIGSDIKKEGVKEVAYQETPIDSLLSLISALEHVKAGLSQIRCPIALFTSEEDHVVNPVSSKTIVNEVRSPVVHYRLENSYHVATLDNDAPFIIDKSLEFLKEFF